jgi:hypothetical protein
MSNRLSGFARHFMCSRWAKEFTPEYPHCGMCQPSLMSSSFILDLERRRSAQIIYKRGILRRGGEFVYIQAGSEALRVQMRRFR